MLPAPEVTECIDQRFAADPVDFIPDDRVQRTRPALDDHTKINVPLDGEFLPNQRKCIFEIKRAAVETTGSISNAITASVLFQTSSALLAMT